MSEIKHDFPTSPYDDVAQLRQRPKQQLSLPRFPDAKCSRSMPAEELAVIQQWPESFAFRKREPLVPSTTESMQSPFTPTTTLLEKDHPVPRQTFDTAPRPILEKF
ncbi:hypothetical protein [Ralstonia pseudosolanacearum]|uniref:hypothetical protein n=1 Tax=Ralstonia pseudosolanacearum TaxID=1310165 RepID=UPI001FF82B12|nr:hypothetical protein [Ralstonia pseudosolanacearum]